MDPMDEKLYTVNELRDHFKVTRETVYEWMRTGRLAYIYVGGRRRVTGSALRAFIDAGGTARGEDTEKNAEPQLMTAFAA